GRAPRPRQARRLTGASRAGRTALLEARKQGRLIGARTRARGAAAAGSLLGGRRGSLPARLGRRGPALLARDLVALLDDEKVDDAGQRVADEGQIPDPVARREGEGPHLVQREREGGAVALARGEPEVVEDPGLAGGPAGSDARAAHARTL